MMGKRKTEMRASGVVCLSSTVPRTYALGGEVKRNEVGKKGKAVREREDNYTHKRASNRSTIYTPTTAHQMRPTEWK